MTPVNMHLAPLGVTRGCVSTTRQDRRLGACCPHAIGSTCGGLGGANRASRTWCTQRTYRGRVSRPCASRAVQSGNASFLP
jgi:hypothetical protein